MKECRECGETKAEDKFLKKDKTLCLECNRVYMRKWRAEKAKDPAYVKKEQEKQRRWWEKNRERGNKRQREYRKNNKTFQLSNALRARVKYALEGCVKRHKTFDLLGCSPEEWKSFLEDKFEEGMTWENYGTDWEVDHIIPVSHFDLEDDNEQKKAFHYENTQPMWAVDNRRKGNRWVG